MKVLALVPKTPPQLGGFSEGLPWWKLEANQAPRDLALIAALTPPGIDLILVDQNTSDRLDFEAELDLVVCIARDEQLPPLRYLAGRFRARRIPLAVAGPAVLAHPARADMADIKLIGPLERTWPELLRRWQEGERDLREVRCETLETLVGAPRPDWSRLSLRRYRVGVIEVVRAAENPHLETHALEPQYQTAAGVLEELEALTQLGVHSVFLDAPDLLARPTQAREVLEALAHYQTRARRKVRFETRLALASTRDDTLLELLPAANVRRVELALNHEVLPPLHLHEDPRVPIEAVRRLLELGIRVVGSLTLGREGDDTAGLASLVAIARESNATPIPKSGRALPGTSLYQRLKDANRLVSVGRDAELRRELFDSPNYRPATVRREEVAAQLRQLILDLYEPSRIATRLNALSSEARRSPPADLRLAVRDLEALCRMAAGSFSHPTERRGVQILGACQALVRHSPHAGLWSQILEQLLEEAANRSLVSRTDEGRPLEGTVPTLSWKQRMMGLGASVVGRLGQSPAPAGA